MKVKKGFTLIELLIVVLIIAILAAIAVPNFMEFQTRAKVSRVKSDMRNITTALEAYRVDQGSYPMLRLYLQMGKNDQQNRDGIHNAVDLTTPIAYMSSVDIPDPFGDSFGRDRLGNIPHGESTRPFSIGYCNVDYYWEQEGGTRRPESKDVPWVLVSLGPDYVKGPGARPGGGTGWAFSNYCQWARDCRDEHYQDYDPTNGTNSGGDVLRFP